MTGLTLAEFRTPHETLEAARLAARNGHRALDALLPMPIDGLVEQLEPRRRRTSVGWVMFIAGASGAALGYLMQWYSAVIDYPILSGGRPLDSWPVFLLVPYEMAILAAGICGLLAWLWACGLPRLHHPLFDLDAVEAATQDRYFLIFRDDRGLDDWLTDAARPAARHKLAR